MGNSFKDFLEIQISRTTKKRLSPSTVEHYTSNIKNISRLFKDKQTIKKDLISMSYNEFIAAFEAIEKDP